MKLQNFRSSKFAILVYMGRSVFFLKWIKWAQNLAKVGFLKFLEILNYFLLEAILSERLYDSLFPCSSMNLEKIWFASFRPIYTQPIRLQDSLIINTSGRNQLIS